MMKTRILSRASAAVLAALMILSCTFGAFAVGLDYSSSHLLSDEADLFTQSEFTELSGVLKKEGAKTGWQLAVVTTTDGVSSSRMDSYYNNYYDNNRLYFQTDCVMFVIDNGSGNRIILTHGAAEAYFDDDRMSALKSALKPALSSGDMVLAVTTFATTSSSYYEQGIDEDASHDNHVEGTETEAEKQKRENKFLYVLTHFGWIIGLVSLAGGGIFAGVNVGRYKFNGKSGTYDLNKNSNLQLLDSQDVFVNKTTTYTTIQSSSSSSGGSSGGGGSSSHGSSGSF